MPIAAPLLPPPSPERLTNILITVARCLLLSTAGLIAAWAVGPLGGLGAWSRGADGGSGDAPPSSSTYTARLFNWHPLLMSLAFLVFAGEALLAYRSHMPAPLALTPTTTPPPQRPARKAAHASLHALALLVALLGSTAAWRSHELAAPPIPHLYSPHSWVGLAAMLAFLLQAAAGASTFLSRSSPPERRAALAPWHRLAGLCVFFMTLAAIATGLQEKATFAQAFGGAPVRGRVVGMAAAAELGMVLSGVAVALVFFAPVGGGGGCGGGGDSRDDLAEEGLLRREQEG
jgi:cytochrome b-561